MNRWEELEALERQWLEAARRRADRLLLLFGFLLGALAALVLIGVATRWPA